jgi:maltooligosyltrehalose trehalohydrolase
MMAQFQEFTVWAPKPDKVRVDIDGEVHPMTRSRDGWWWTTIDAAPTARYGYLLDDDPKVLPDPRSPRQPDGVHGRSQLWEPATQAWTDGGWTGRSVQGAVIYELHIGTFTLEGTFDSTIEKLDYLVDLGVDFVEVMPVNAFSGTHGWGYDGVLWYAVHEPYGGPDGLIRFVDACHRRGLGVLIDAVFNHLGPSGNYLPRFGPYLSSASNPWGEGINIADAGSDEVRRYIIDCALRWMRDFHADGLRLDAVHALVDTTAIHLLEELSAETDALAEQLGRPLSLVAESDLNDPRMITPRRSGGYGMTAQWDDDIHHAIHTAVSGERQGYYADFGSLLLPRRHIFIVSKKATRTTAGHHSGLRDPGHPAAGLHLHPRPGRQSCARRPPVAEPHPWPVGGQSRAGARVSLHCNAFHGRGMGSVDPVSILQLPSRAGAGARHRRRTQEGVRRSRMGRRRDSRPAGPADLPALETGLG